MKKIGFLSFGHWTDHPQSGTRSASDVLLQSIDLAVAAEELGADGAYWVGLFNEQKMLRVTPAGGAADTASRAVSRRTAAVGAPARGRARWR